MWALYEHNSLTPETRLTGKFKGSSRKADTMSLIEQIQDEAKEFAERQEAQGGLSKYAARKAKRVQQENDAAAAEQARLEKAKAKQQAKQAANKNKPPEPGATKNRSRRRRRRRNGRPNPNPTS
jgi:RIO kinase 1